MFDGIPLGVDGSPIHQERYERFRRRRSAYSTSNSMDEELFVTAWFKTQAKDTIGIPNHIPRHYLDILKTVCKVETTRNPYHKEVEGVLYPKKVRSSARVKLRELKSALKATGLVAVVNRIGEKVDGWSLLVGNTDTIRRYLSATKATYLNGTHYSVHTITDDTLVSVVGLAKAEIPIEKEHNVLHRVFAYEGSVRIRESFKSDAYDIYHKRLLDCKYEQENKIKENTMKKYIGKYNKVVLDVDGNWFKTDLPVVEGSVVLVDMQSRRGEESYRVIKVEEVVPMTELTPRAMEAQTSANLWVVDVIDTAPHLKRIENTVLRESVIKRLEEERANSDSLAVYKALAAENPKMQALLEQINSIDAVDVKVEPAVPVPPQQPAHI